MIIKYIGWVITILLFAMITKKLYVDYVEKKEIVKNKGVTEGEIIDYYIVGTDSPYLIYLYVIEGKEYKKTTSILAFMGCEKSKNCIGRRFLVYYSKKHPQMSEIDLSNELIQ